MNKLFYWLTVIVFSIAVGLASALVAQAAIKRVVLYENNGVYLELGTDRKIKSFEIQSTNGKPYKFTLELE